MTALGLPFVADPATVRALDEARAMAILVGSYDGSGNYGDIAQLDAALRLLQPLKAELLAVPVLERAHLAAHRELLAAFQHPPEHALFFDPESSWEGEGMIPVPVPPTLAAGAIYLYGGGYLNPSWGERKLAMMRAATDLLQAAAVTEPTRIASGLQVDPDWLGSLPVADSAPLRSFAFLGARDPLSAQAMAALDSPAKVMETGDDALAAIPAMATARPEPDSPELVVNLHFAEHEWVSGRPAELRTQALDLIAELGRRADRPVRVRPLIAYLDGRIDERPGIEELSAEAARRGIEIEEPQVLRPSELTQALPQMGRALATISCSYHVALTSLLLGVPTVVFADNPYYRQKVAGLAAAFGLPPSFAFSPGTDPEPVAAAIFDGGGGLREEIASSGDGLRRSRAVIETELLSCLAGGLLAQTTAEIGRLDERLRDRSSEPAELQVELASLRTQAEELRQPAIQAAVLAARRAADRAEERAQQAEERAAAEVAAAHGQLAVVLGSRSWRLAAPVRWVGSFLRRLKRALHS